MNTSSISAASTLTLLMLGPVLFLCAFIALGWYYIASGLASDAVPGEVARNLPHILVFVLATLGIVAGCLAPATAASIWQRSVEGDVVRPALIGATVGAALAAIYLLALAPALGALQGHIGDYVPPGAVLAGVSSNLWMFFLANVVLAPAVEETIFRGVAFQFLSERLGPIAAAALTCLSFGFLHWAGGVWYMLLTATVAGGIFTALLLWQRSIIAPFAAHLTLNAIEFAYAAGSGT